MSSDVLPLLAKAGGISALAIGVVYLLYSQIIKAGVIPKLRQWQGFTLLCLLAALIFAMAMAVLLKVEAGPSRLNAAEIYIEPPSKVDIRTSVHPSKAPSTWNTERAVLIHDVVYRSTTEPARSAYVSGIRARLTLDGKDYPFEWRNFVNMHEEKEEWLSITGDARTFQVVPGTVEAREVLHHSNPVEAYESVLSAIAKSTSATGRVSIITVIDEKQVEATCTLNLQHWRKVLGTLMRPEAGTMPARFTMCCAEHPKSKQDSLCGPT